MKTLQLLTACRRLTFALALAASATLGAGSLSAAMSGPVKTEAGLLSGVPGRDSSVTIYKGVPYAAPPVGDLRSKAPQPPIPLADKAKFDFLQRFFAAQEAW